MNPTDPPLIRQSSATPLPTHVLTISRWDDVFETAASRKLVRLQYVNTPSGVDSAGYLELVTMHGAAGVTALGAFGALCQLTATWEYARRGKFVKTNGTPMSLPQIAAYVRIPLDLLETAVELLSDEAVGWLRWVPATDPPLIRQSSASDLPPKRIEGKELEGKEERDRGAREGGALPLEIRELIDASLDAYPKQTGRYEAQRILGELHGQGVDLMDVFHRTRVIAAVVKTRTQADRLRIPSMNAFFENRRWLDDPEAWRSARSLERQEAHATTKENGGWADLPSFAEASQASETPTPTPATA